ncbi:MAG: hypothetical protein HN509_14935 [Halobacteriovoraceae bacterium]|jgi:hypothetical protein|nr:hypothetical protein [Halobacteriovoraceae bacterium]MBT5093245.1 hypothetical protein [Halobacteriovoraceae bacterium]
MIRRSIIFLTILGTFLVPPLTVARDDYNEDPFLAFLDLEKVSCIKEILLHPYTKGQYPGLLSEQKIESHYTMLKEIDQFCNCSISKRQVELKLKKRRPIEWHFLDRKKRLGMEDQCAMAKFGDKAMELYYAIIVSTRIRGGLENRLVKRQPTSIRFFASSKSYSERINCLQSKILRRCTRIKSLRNTYQCIEEITASGDKLQKLEDDCPPLIEKENQGNDTPEDRKQFI